MLTVSDEIWFILNYSYFIHTLFTFYSNLINDLDIRVTKDGVTYYPWTLNPAVPTDGAVRTGDNFRDNFEKSISFHNSFQALTSKFVL